MRNRCSGCRGNGHSLKAGERSKDEVTIAKCLLSAHCTEPPTCPVVSLGVTGSCHSQCVGEHDTGRGKEGAEETLPHLPVPILSFSTLARPLCSPPPVAEVQRQGPGEALAQHILPHKVAGGRGRGSVSLVLQWVPEPHGEERGRLGCAHAILPAAPPVSGLALRHTPPSTEHTLTLTPVSSGFEQIASSHFI